MQVFTRYKPLRAKKRSPWPAFLLVIAALGLIGWWWKSRPTSEQNGKATATQPPARRQPDSSKPAHEDFTPTRQASPARAERPPTTLTHSSSSGFLLPTNLVDRAEKYPRPVRTILEGQIALTRLALSPGSLDGAVGSRTRAALLAFQEQRKLALTGSLDPATRSRLMLTTPPTTNRVIASEDLSRLRPLGRTWLEKSKQDRLDYESILELMAEASQSYPSLIRQLNPGIDWTNVTVGTVVVVPDVTRPPLAGRAAFAQIELEGRTLQVFDDATNVVGHFPCSVAKFAEKRPVGELHVTVLAPNPNYTFDPENFPESAEARTIDHKLILQPGPNNPVGTVWIGLDRPGYGIHGTPHPEQVGRAESHGCFRLANWNAEYLLPLVWIGMPVYVLP